MLDKNFSYAILSKYQAKQLENKNILQEEVHIMNKEFLEGLELIIKGLETIKNSCKDSISQKAEIKKEAKEEESSKEVKESVDGEDIPSEDELKGMTYNQVKSLAKKMGLDMTGSKADIVERILNADSEEQEEPEDTNNEQEDGEDAEPTIQDQVEEMVAEMSNEEIADILANAGISAKGGRQALITKLVKAVEDGKIELEDEGSESESESDSEEGEEIDLEEVLEGLEVKDLKAVAKAVGVKLGIKDKTAEDVISKLLADEDKGEAIVDYLVENGIIQTEGEEESEPLTVEAVMEHLESSEYFQDMSKKRTKAVKEQVKDILAQIESGEVTLKDMEEIVQDFFVSDDEADLVEQAKGDNDVVLLFIEAYCRLIDNDGELHEFQEPYEVGDYTLCCGHTLEETDEGFKCPVCEAEYEAEE